MRRRLLKFVVVLSSLAAGLTAAVWARSYFVADEVVVTRGTDIVGVYSGGGMVVVVGHRAPRDRGRDVRWVRRWATSGTPYSVGRLEALGVFRHVKTRAGGYCVFPHWPVPAVLGAPLWVWWGVRRVRRGGTSVRKGQATGGAAAGDGKS